MPRNKNKKKSPNKKSGEQSREEIKTEFNIEDTVEGTSPPGEVATPTAADIALAPPIRPRAQTAAPGTTTKRMTMKVKVNMMQSEMIEGQIDK